MTLERWQIESALLALHNIASALGAMCLILGLIFVFKDCGKR